MDSMNKINLNFSNLQIVDSHCHYFNFTYADHDLRNTPTLSLNQVSKEDLRNTLAYMNMLSYLKAFLGVQGPEEDILSERKRRMQENYRQYVIDLLRDANIDTFIIDVGYMPAQVSAKAFEELVPAKVYYVYRIETVIDEIWEQKLTFRQAEDKFYETLEEAFVTPRLVAIKELIGYRTGLDIKQVNRISLINDAPNEKQFRDYFFLCAVEKSIKKGYPIQVHTGFGESNIDISTNNPLLLKGFLEDPKYREATIILLHGSYPYSFEAGYLANVYPNVYLDLSAMNVFGPPYVFRAGINNIFQFCPFNKAMYGSDGELIPDTHWLGAKVAKKELSLLFSTYIKDGLFNEDYAVKAAKMILSDTARILYHLS